MENLTVCNLIVLQLCTVYSSKLNISSRNFKPLACSKYQFVHGLVTISLVALVLNQLILYMHYYISYISAKLQSNEQLPQK